MSKLHKKSIYPFLDFYQKHRWDIIHWPASPTAGCRLDKALKTWAQKTIWVPTERDGASLTLACPLSSLWRWKSRRAELTSDQAQQVDWEGNPFIFPLCTPRHSSQQNFPVSSWLIYPPGKSFIILFWLRLHSSRLEKFSSHHVIFFFQEPPVPPSFTQPPFSRLTFSNFSSFRVTFTSWGGAQSWDPPPSFLPATLCCTPRPLFTPTLTRDTSPCLAPPGLPSPPSPPRRTPPRSRITTAPRNPTRLPTLCPAPSMTMIKLESRLVPASYLGNYSARSRDKSRAKTSNWFKMSGWETEMLSPAPCSAIISDNFSCDCQSKRLPPALDLFQLISAANYEY